jgi:acyl-CoA thioesterase I
LGFLAWGFSLACLAQNTAPNNAPPVVLIVGDSLSAEYGLRRGSGWVALLQAQIDAQGPAARVVNASISGDTTSGGRSRLAALLRQHQPKVVIIELGGNDALRGLPLTMTQDNLSDMTRRSKAAGARVLLLGMEMPPNYGTQYSESFKRVFTQVAKAQGVALVPFFLTGVADAKDPLALFQSDRIHPNEQAQPIMMRNVWPSLRRLLSQR